MRTDSLFTSVVALSLSEHLTEIGLLLKSFVALFEQSRKTVTLLTSIVVLLLAKQLTDTLLTLGGCQNFSTVDLRKSH